MLQSTQLGCIKFLSFSPSSSTCGSFFGLPALSGPARWLDPISLYRQHLCTFLAAALRPQSYRSSSLTFSRFSDATGLVSRAGSRLTHPEEQLKRTVSPANEPGPSGHPLSRNAAACAAVRPIVPPLPPSAIFRHSAFARRRWCPRRK
jgi:hypothetical protein